LTHIWHIFGQYNAMLWLLESFQEMFSYW
jgi:hypothetical protein